MTAIEYKYGMLVRNYPKRKLHQEKTLLNTPFEKTKYALIERVSLSDKTEKTNAIYYSNDIDELRNRLYKYLTWYDYEHGTTKNIQGYISEFNSSLYHERYSE